MVGIGRIPPFLLQVVTVEEISSVILIFLKINMDILRLRSKINEYFILILVRIPITADAIRPKSMVTIRGCTGSFGILARGEGELGDFDLSDFLGTIFILIKFRIKGRN